MAARRMQPNDATASNVRRAPAVTRSRSISSPSQQSARPRAAQPRQSATPSRTASAYARSGMRPIPSASRPRGRHLSPTRIVAALVAIVVLVGVAAAGMHMYSVRPVDITVNGQTLSIACGSTVAQAKEAANVTVPAGKLIAIDDSVVDDDAFPYEASIDGVAVDPDARIDESDTLTIDAGVNRYESYTVTATAVVPAGVTDDETRGAIHTIEGDSADGASETRKGDVSGKTVDVVITEPKNAVLHRHNVDTGGKKLIALTFDDGPWEFTGPVLDVLREHDAKATFFVVGERIDGTSDGASLVKRAHDEGHQVCTHSYDHARGDGGSVNLGLMTPEAQIDEVVHGQQVITDAIGTEASKVFRAPGGNYSPEVAARLHPYVTSEIGWNIDTGDWQRPGVGSIKQQIMSAEDGNVVLMHDGGGNRSQTIEALKAALPALKKKGYTFVTVDDLLAADISQT